MARASSFAAGLPGANMKLPGPAHLCLTTTYFLAQTDPYYKVGSIYFAAKMGAK